MRQYSHSRHATMRRLLLQVALTQQPDGAISVTDQFTNPATEAAIHQLELMVDSRIGSTSPSVLHAIEEEASKVRNKPCL